MFLPKHGEQYDWVYIHQIPSPSSRSPLVNPEKHVHIILRSDFSVFAQSQWSTITTVPSRGKRQQRRKCSGVEAEQSIRTARILPKTEGRRRGWGSRRRPSQGFHTPTHSLKNNGNPATFFSFSHLPTVVPDRSLRDHDGTDEAKSLRFLQDQKSPMFGHSGTMRQLQINTILTACTSPPPCKRSPSTSTPNPASASPPLSQPPSSRPASFPQVPLPSNSLPSTTERPCALPALHIDRLLAEARSLTGAGQERPTTFRDNQLFIRATASLTFFSEPRLSSISTQLGNQRVNELLHRITHAIRSRMKPSDPISVAISGAESSPRPDTAAAKSYVKSFFQDVYPTFPFLNRAEFEAKIVSASETQQQVSQSPAFSALYYTILALGCHCQQDGGSFEPGHGLAWQHFSVALRLFPQLSTLPDSLVLLQALTAMAIFGLSVSCVAIEHSIVSEAAQRARNLAGAEQTRSSAASYHQTFWVLYSVEKLSSFYFGRCSDLFDNDITVPIPVVPVSIYSGGFDWYLTFARHARLLSRALTSLFSPGAAGSPPSQLLSTISELQGELEAWRLSIPPPFRPQGSDSHGPALSKAVIPTHQVARRVGLWTHYLYHSFHLILSRASLHLLGSLEDGGGGGGGPEREEKEEQSSRGMYTSARRILELIKFVDLETHSPLWISLGIPLWALFVLFDFVLHHPAHPDTGSNLALLDMVGGHFGHVEYASNGALPGSLITEFVYVAREYVNDVNRQRAIQAQGDVPKLRQTPGVAGGIASPALADKEPLARQQPLLLQPVQRQGQGQGQGQGQEQGQQPQGFDLEAKVGSTTLPTARPVSAQFPPSLESATAFVNNDASWFGDDLDATQTLGADVMNLFTYFIPDGDLSMM
ncbi:Fungal Zn2-Cys6 binuclear cluster domain-containing protein [Zalerion maritima]|uniref:Fungal Zn2-Cys6 binuclear cluster domain-containing protein n=1 Tax=Zalerion maritima TaxID=339359 RepID=A0AAD5RI41_9PEZI|nr:Fungal Zn2-Cys6 binuclear cluster domain-containing protein [Zalerion maritima]